MIRTLVRLRGREETCFTLHETQGRSAVPPPGGGVYTDQRERERERPEKERQGERERERDQRERERREREREKWGHINSNLI